MRLPFTWTNPLHPWHHWWLIVSGLWDDPPPPIINRGPHYE